MSAMAPEITSLTIVYSIVYSGTGQRKHQSFASQLASLRGIHRLPVNSPHKGPVTRKKNKIFRKHNPQMRAMYLVSFANSSSALCTTFLSVQSHNLGPDSLQRCPASIGNPAVEIRRSLGCLITRKGFPIIVRLHLYIEPSPLSL